MNYGEFSTRVFHNELKKVTAFSIALDRLQSSLPNGESFKILNVSKTESTYHLETYYDYTIWYKIKTKPITKAAK